ncbi:MAG: universal stress protein [Pararhizobium sp.]
MKTVLVPVEAHDRTDGILDTAVAFVRNFASCLTGFPLAPATTPFLAADVIGASVIYEPLAEYNEESVAKARALFEAAMRRHEIKRSTSGEEPSWSWRNDVPPGDHVVGNLGRVYDVTVVGRPEARLSGPRGATLDAALFDSGRPILIAPPVPTETVGRRVLIAWNRSTETARTVAFAMPVLRQAEEIVVLSVEGSQVAGPTGEELVAYLRLNGLSARALSTAQAKGGPGPTILAEARELGSDLVVKGAFTQSRIRQIIFGGATQHIITETELPVFMAH